MQLPGCSAYQLSLPMSMANRIKFAPNVRNPRYWKFGRNDRNLMVSGFFRGTMEGDIFFSALTSDLSMQSENVHIVPFGTGFTGENEAIRIKTCYYDRNIGDESVQEGHLSVVEGIAGNFASITKAVMEFCKAFRADFGAKWETIGGEIMENGLLLIRADDDISNQIIKSAEKLGKSVSRIVLNYSENAHMSIGFMLRHLVLAAYNNNILFKKEQSGIEIFPAIIMALNTPLREPNYYIRSGSTDPILGLIHTALETLSSFNLEDDMRKARRI